MGYNKENYSRIRKTYQTKYLKAYEEAERRTEEVHRKSPAVAAIDRELSTTGAQVALAAIGTGAEYKTKLAEVEARNLELQKKRAELLAQMGYPADYTLPPYECAACRDSGFIGTKMCECMRRELILAAYESSGLGQLMQKQSFESFDLSFYTGKDAESMRANVDKLRAYAESFTPHADNLILCGPTGLGKTHLSTAVARSVIDKGYDVYYTTAIDLFSEFERARFGAGDARQEADSGLSRYTDCDLLILDDLGTEVINQFSTSCLYLVLNNRISLGRPTIINTNLIGKDLKEKYAERITSRIFGEFKAMRFSGTDVRRQKLDRK